MHRAPKRKGVTLALVWEGYRAAHPEDGYGYSRSCELCRRWEGRLSPRMRQHRFAGERAFVDHAGDTLEVIDGATGGVRQAQIFVGMLGASNDTFVEASWTQTLPDRIASHVRMPEFFSGAPGQPVSDNLEAGVTKACFCEPKGNRSYADLAAHYGTAILPARPWRPRDKAKVEVGVQLVQRWIVARLRGRQFFSLAGPNAAIRELLEAFDGKATRHLGARRRQLFETLDRPALKALPARPCERAGRLEHHVEIGKHCHSVPPPFFAGNSGRG
ncbi:hypothetical protein LNKW23_49060 [Paralimibaculum aggregatum]|uniref:Integrase catalytic domain-containing protein n=1 Tax=Paralimibaculum aggregatum TaxID=3036245 RepID=A0ABQ6LUG2_9RHOB|nr:IS21 family transposase [Limibaculum sp. NKW23]GMG85677.1 hypothetical protein LNKW23_49060 [Limibaculum sp. NKW23]